MHPPLPMPRPRAAVFAALAGALLILLLQAMPSVQPALEYRRALLADQPWRLLTAHVVHVNWTHALVNAAAWLVLARLFAAHLDARGQLLSFALGAACTSLGLAIGYPPIDWYRGASAALHALFFAGATVSFAGTARRLPWTARLLPLGLLVGGWAKVGLEMPRDAITPYADWLSATTVPQAHLFGAISGTALGLLFAFGPRRRTTLRR